MQYPRQRLESFLRLSGCPPSPPLPPPAGHTLRLETSQDFGGTGGRAEAGFLPRFQKPASARLIRPDFGLTTRYAGRPKTYELLACRHSRARKCLRLRTRKTLAGGIRGEPAWNAFLCQRGIPLSLAGLLMGLKWF